MDYIFTGVFTFEMVMKVRYLVALVTLRFAHPPLWLRWGGACNLLRRRVVGVPWVCAQ